MFTEACLVNRLRDWLLASHGVMTVRGMGGELTWSHTAPWRRRPEAKVERRVRSQGHLSETP